MSGATDAPGLAPYSSEWAAAACSRVSEPLVPVVVSICGMFQLDGRAPNSIAKIIEDGLREALSTEHTLSDGSTLRPFFVAFDGSGWRWMGANLAGELRSYSSDEIEKRGTA